MLDFSFFSVSHIFFSSLSSRRKRRGMGKRKIHFIKLLKFSAHIGNSESSLKEGQISQRIIKAACRSSSKFSVLRLTSSFPSPFLMLEEKKLSDFLRQLWPPMSQKKKKKKPLQLRQSSEQSMYRSISVFGSSQCVFCVRLRVMPGRMQGLFISSFFEDSFSFLSLRGSEEKYAQNYYQQNMAETTCRM